LTTVTSAPKRRNIWANSTTVMELGEVPGHLLVVGGGYTGLEFAQMFRRFGADVTVVNRGPRLLGREDPDIAGAMAEILREEGIEVLLETDTAKVAPRPDGRICLTVAAKGGGQERVLEGTHLLVATGRDPNTDRLDPDAGGVATDDKGNIPTDGRLQTNVPGVYALGDVRGGPAFTHVSYDDFRVIRANLIEGGDRTIDDRIIPYTVFTDPQLGRIGMSERDARDAGKRIKVAKLPMSSVARALETDEPRGLMKAVVDAETDRILGAAVLGLDGGEVASMLQIAMLGDLPYTALRDAMLSHPTLAESLNNLFGSFEA
jgi:pyruvate/2-oxoglutarate dehydrogenase complex dihydrolipoamide dehydrogenase (E3) component